MKYIFSLILITCVLSCSNQCYDGLCIGDQAVFVSNHIYTKNVTINSVDPITTKEFVPVNPISRQNILNKKEYQHTLNKIEANLPIRAYFSATIGHGSVSDRWFDYEELRGDTLVAFVSGVEIKKSIWRLYLENHRTVLMHFSQKKL